MLSALPAVASAGLLHISATVKPYARVEMQSAPPSLSITAADVERGFVDVQAPMVFTITSNLAQGARLVFATVSSHVEKTRVTGFAEPFYLGRSLGSLQLPGASTGLARSALSLHFRFHLSADTPPGVYPWPLRVATEFL